MRMALLAAVEVQTRGQAEEAGHVSLASCIISWGSGR